MRNYSPNFRSISRTICPTTGIHYLDGICDGGGWWRLELKKVNDTWVKINGEGWVRGLPSTNNGSEK